MYIYKLKYKNEDDFIKDFINLSIIDEFGNYLDGTIIVVKDITVTIIDPVFNDKNELISPPVLSEGYHVDVMLNREVYFENEVFPNNPKHTFFGH